MAFKATSVEGKVYEVSRKPLQAHLYDFDIDGAIVKPEHLRWLSRMVVQPARLLGSAGPGTWHIWIFGNASTTGSDSHNLKLGERRATQVRAHLAVLLAGTPHKIHLIPVGEAKAQRDGLPDEVELDFYRSVSIVVGFFTSPPPPPPKPKFPVRSQIKIRVVKVAVMQHGFGIGPLDFGHSLVIVQLEIKDETNCRIAGYEIKDTLADVSLGSGLPLPDVPEYTLWPVPTPWQDFKTSAPIDSFAGYGRILDVDDTELVFRLSRDNAPALRGPTFTFRNPQAKRQNPLLQPLPSVPVLKLIGGRVTLRGEVRPCQK